MMASVAAEALAMPSARCPAARPMLMMMIPARSGARVLRQIADNVNAVVPCRFKSERRRRTGQRQIVVNRLGHVRDLDAAFALFGHDAGGKRRVVAANGHQRGDAELFKNAEDIFHLRFGLRGVRARGSQDGAAAQMDFLHVTDRQRPAILHLALREPFEAVPEADDFVALIDAFDGGRRDDAVDARRRAATDQNSQSAFAH